MILPILNMDVTPFVQFLVFVAYIGLIFGLSVELIGRNPLNMLRIRDKEEGSAMNAEDSVITSEDSAITSEGSALKNEWDRFFGYWVTLRHSLLWSSYPYSVHSLTKYFYLRLLVYVCKVLFDGWNPFVFTAKSFRYLASFSFASGMNWRCGNVTYFRACLEMKKLVESSFELRKPPCV